MIILDTIKKKQCFYLSLCETASSTTARELHTYIHQLDWRTRIDRTPVMYVSHERIIKS